MAEEKDYSKHIMNERITKSFSTDLQTLGMIKDFKEKYHRNSLSETIDDLVNIGLANLGYKTEKEIEERFKGIGLSSEKITIPKPRSSNIDSIALRFSHSQHERMREILDIIERLSKESRDFSVNLADIINDAKIYGIESHKVEEVLDQLLRDGQLIKTPLGNYALMTYP